MIDLPIHTDGTAPEDWLCAILSKNILNDCHASGEAKGGEDEDDDPEVPEALDHD